MNTISSGGAEAIGSRRGPDRRPGWQSPTNGVQMNISLSRSVRVATVAVALASLLLPFATPAQAAAAPPPTCATLTKNATATVLTVRNNCDTTVRLRVIVSPTVVIGCSLYTPGSIRVISVPSGAPEARLESC